MPINIIIALGALIIGVLITLVVCHFLPKEKIRTANQELEKKENETQLRIKDLEKEYIEKKTELETQYNELNEQYYQDIQKQDKELKESAARQLTEIDQARRDWEKEKNEKLLNWSQREADLKAEVRGLEERKESIIETLEKEAQESGKIFKDQQLKIAEEQIEKAKNEMQANFEEASEQAKQEYLNVITDLLCNIQEQYLVSKEELEIALNKLNEAQAKANAAVEVNKRAELDRQQKDFYRLQLSDLDLEEIKKIRSIEPYLRQKEPLNKVVWKVYYEKPYTDLIGRVVGAGRHTGIYKITNIENGMCYIGQAVDIADRWKQHIKRGIGAETPTQNKLYPAMLSIGVENFTFEIVEECLGKDLSSREDYWQDFYHAKDFGYSIK